MVVEAVVALQAEVCTTYPCSFNLRLRGAIARVVA